MPLRRLRFRHPRLPASSAARANATKGRDHSVDNTHSERAVSAPGRLRVTMRTDHQASLNDSCRHESIVHDPEWSGFGQPVKDMDGDTRPCDLCADAGCPVGNILRLSAFRVRAAQLVAKYGYWLDVEVNLGAHGIDLRCTMDGVTWIWEFTTDDPASLGQAMDNRDHIVEQLRAQGVDARPGLPFEPDWSAGLMAPGHIVEVASHATEPGVEVFDVFHCEPCYRRGTWRYAESRMRHARLEDLLFMQIYGFTADGSAVSLPAPNGRHTPSEYSDVHLQLSLDNVAAAESRALLRTWYETAVTLLDADLLAEILHAPPDGHHPHRGQPGTAAGVLKVEPDDVFKPRERQLDEASWATYLDTSPAEGIAWFGPVSQYGWAQTGNDGQFLVLEHRAHGTSGDALALTASVNSARLDDCVFGQRWLAVARSLCDQLPVSHAEIGHRPFRAETRVRDLTMLDRLLYRYPADSIAASRSMLRGYAWLTVLPRELGDVLGGVEKLAATGVFHEVARLDTGGYWLLATEHFDEYDTAAAERVFHVLAPVLPPGLPARSTAEPHMIILRDARPAVGG
ncbi:hypothetical protein [Catellatospora methionotrophica]|uniref:hypothetical protein n=1 Tax=Catellatospora methionotrophica TaxID=121620 RepID=UPI0033C003DA